MTPLHSAAFNGHTNTVSALVKELGADVNAKNSDGHTPLHDATINTHTDTVVALVKELVVNAMGKNGGTPLHLAAMNDTVRAFVEPGADVNAMDTVTE